MSRLKLWLIWLFSEPKFFWFILSALGFAIVTLWTFSEFVFKSYGFTLQVVGIFFAAREVFSNERLFGQPRIRDRIEGWWNRRPRRSAVVGVAGLSLSGLTGHARGIGREPRSLTDTLDVQVAKLWKNIDYIGQEITALAGQVDQNKGTFEAAFKAEREAREQSERAIKDLIKEATVGSPLLAYFGVSLVLLGSAITTYSMDLHNWVK